MTMPDVYSAEPIPASARAEVERLLGSGDLFRYTSDTPSPVALLEAEFADMLGAKFALAVASCSAALFLSLRALGLSKDAKVLIPAFTFAAVPSSVVHADCRPVLVECGDNFRINLEDFHQKIAQGAEAIIISHMRGHTSDMDAIIRAAEVYGIPVIEDAAHSLGTTWGGKNIGTIGAIGCFSFQSYKLLNAGEGGILVSDDPELMAKMVIMSGAYEHNWKKHPVLQDHFATWQNKLPLYNTRLGNLSASVVRPQLAELPRRVADGRRNHDYVAEKLNTSAWIDVPPAMPKELRAPDSLQFNLVGMNDEQVLNFAQIAKDRGVSVQVFGMSEDNARAFWNWQFLDHAWDLPMTKNMLMRACDTRLPARLTIAELDVIVAAILDSIELATRAEISYGT